MDAIVYSIRLCKSDRTCCNYRVRLVSCASSVEHPIRVNVLPWVIYWQLSHNRSTLLSQGILLIYNQNGLE